MSEQITIQVSERVVRHATHMAAENQQRIDEVLAGWLEWVITEMPVETLSDEEVLELTELQLTTEKQETLSNLLAQNREGTLDAGERCKLDELMQVYEHGLLRKAQALRVAVQRGLREPLQPRVQQRCLPLCVSMCERLHVTAVATASTHSVT